PSPLRDRIVKPIFTVWTGFGLTQDWKLFCPKIRDLNFHCAAIISYADGINEVWEPTRFDTVSVPEKFLGDRMRKWCVDCLPWPDHKEYWAGLCRYLVRSHQAEANAPTNVSLHYRWIAIPPPDHFTPRSQLPFHTNFWHTFFYSTESQDIK